MEIATWKDERYKGDQCPKCRLLNQNFPIFELDGFKVFVCMESHCGTLFIPKSERNKIDVKTLMNPLACTVCGKVCKNKLGLNSHLRSHGFVKAILG